MNEDNKIITEDMAEAELDMGALDMTIDEAMEGLAEIAEETAGSAESREEAAMEEVAVSDLKEDAVPEEPSEAESDDQAEKPEEVPADEQEKVTGEKTAVNKVSEPEEQEPEKQKKWVKELLEWVRDIAIAVVIALVILAFFKPIVIQQTSMVPTFQSGDYVVTSRQAYKLFGEPERGDVIVFRTELTDERGKDKNLIKRIIGLPGDTVEIREDGYVYINGEKIDEPYLNEQGISDEMEGPMTVTVPEGELFCMGDNRGVSMDSRAIGCIEESTIVGKVVVRLFPLKESHTGF